MKSQIMPLYKAPPGVWVQVQPGDGVKPVVPPSARSIENGEILYFHHVDGSFSLCRNRNGNLVHLQAWQPVKVLGKTLKAALAAEGEGR
jgi:hypothetical protein